MSKRNGNGASPQQKLGELRKEMKGQFVERGNVVDGLLTAMLAGEHVLVLGPPGTAKSAMVEQLCRAVGGQYFSWLLTKFTVPEEIFGPVSLAGLEQDKFIRVTGGKLPEAHFAFADEIWKANSSILNSLLTLVNERVFFNDGRPVPCPLVTLVGASNELPEGAELEALFDRFMLRFWVSYIGDQGALRGMLTVGEPRITARITLAELQKAQAEAAAVALPDEVLDVVLEVKQITERDGVRASDRRWRKALGVLRSYAYLCGESEVCDDHVELLTDVLWREPGERPAIAQAVGRVANPLAAKATEILDAAREAFKTLPDEKAGRAPFLAACAEANATFDEQTRALEQMQKDLGGRRLKKLDDALEEIGRLHKQCSQLAAKAAGIRL